MVNSTLRYEAVVITASDYYSFGSPLIGRTYQAESPVKYRYSFNGKEMDKENNTQDYGLRIYNPELGRFLSVDPLSNEFPWNSPYSFAENNVINAIDIEGAEKYLAIEYTLKNSLGKTFTYKVDYRLVHDGTENSASRNARFSNNPGVIAVVQRLQFNSHSIESGKQTLKRQSNTLASNTLLASQFSNIGANSKYMMGLDLGNVGNKDSKKIMSATVFKAPSVFFGNDKGLTNDDFYQELRQSTTLRNDMDNMAKVLVADPNYKLEVFGYASAKPTDINGSKSSISTENNNELAGMRAEAAKSFLIQYVKDHYCTDIDPSRITTVNGGTLSTTDESKARKVVFKNKL